MGGLWGWGATELQVICGERVKLITFNSIKIAQSIEFSNIRRYGRICPIRFTLPASIRFLVSNPLAKPGRTGNPVQMNRAVDAADVAGEIKIIMHSGGKNLISSVLIIFFTVL